MPLSPSISLFPLLVFLGCSTLVSAQTVTVATSSIFPGGIARSNLTQESTLPLACIDGCWYFAAPYANCFLINSTPNGTIVTGVCDTICTQAYYDGLSACLNCIIANGGERPFGYSTNTSLTAYPTRTSTRASNSIALGADNSASASLRQTLQELENPNGLIDVNQANGWLGNVTRLCGARGTSLSARSVTISATTTGPYATSYSSGQTIVRTAWTGLTQYPPPVTTRTLTVGGGLGPSSGGGPPPSNGASNPAGGGSGSGSGGGGVFGPAASGVAPSQSSRAAGVETLQRPLGWTVGGVLLALAVF